MARPVLTLFALAAAVSLPVLAQEADARMRLQLSAPLLVTSSTPVEPAPDTTPDAHQLAAVTDADPGVRATSEEVVPSGYDTAVEVTVSGWDATISVAGGPPSVSAPISPGQGYRVSMTASPVLGESRAATVKVGDAAAFEWTVTTTDQDRDPDPFEYTTLTGASPGTVYHAVSTSTGGFTGTLTLSADNGALVRAGAGPFSESVQVAPGQIFDVRQTSSAVPGGSVVTTVTLGNYSTTWTIQNAPPETLVPGNTTKVVSRDGFSARCTSWSGSKCMQAELMFDTASEPWTAMQSHGGTPVGNRWHRGHGGDFVPAGQLFCSIATGDIAMVGEPAWNYAGTSSASPAYMFLPAGQNNCSSLSAYKACKYGLMEIGGTTYGFQTHNNNNAGTAGRGMNVTCAGWPQ